MTIEKGMVVSGAIKELALAGTLLSQSPDDTQDGLDMLDDLVAKIVADGLALQYYQPEEYGCSSADDDSGLEVYAAACLKPLLALEFCSSRGLEPPMMVATRAGDAMKTLEHKLVTVEPSEYPGTLPIGSGNEGTGFLYQNKFYPEPEE
ncbi:packaged DNA stabilization gp4 family protein [Vibrio sp. SCSIO 43136]|uniref:packaged DNA stabilization gp4 family protein n=1 Tax=Vibrio sp. SCSIO 43136 TaxID=2819101 RepID=UPI002076435B|nr:packaged DNA stabilization gp4 family protein [Vibrio sp. SCSIO 43136]USD64214.1 hypothetical protein J4N39_08830 [Vibrio sp. SCSIO 43136]